MVIDKARIPWWRTLTTDIVLSLGALLEPTQTPLDEYFTS